MVKNPPASGGDVRDMGLITQSGRSHGGGNGNPFQCSCLENFMDRGAWWAIDYGVRESDMTKQLSVCTHTDNLTLKNNYSSCAVCYLMAEISFPKHNKLQMDPWAINLQCIAPKGKAS